MRKQIAAANWKMNLTYQQAENLLDEMIAMLHSLKHYHEVIFAVPAPYLKMAKDKVGNQANIYVAAQNCYSKKIRRIYRRGFC